MAIARKRSEALEQRIEKTKADARDRVIKRGIMHFRADEAMMSQLLEVAHHKKLPVGSMVRSWVSERLKQEHAHVESAVARLPMADNLILINLLLEQNRYSDAAELVDAAAHPLKVYSELIGDLIGTASEQPLGADLAEKLRPLLNAASQLISDHARFQEQIKKPIAIGSTEAAALLSAACNKASTLRARLLDQIMAAGYQHLDVTV